MRTKFLTVFLCGILLLGLVLPFLLSNLESGPTSSTPVKNFQLSDDSVIWHDDSSNTSLFTQYMDWNMDWWFEDFLVTTGDMTSDGNAFSFSNIPAAVSPVRWHGPIYAHNLSQPFMLSDFQELSVHFDVDNTLGSYSGIINVYLCDEDFVPAIEMLLTDSWDSQSYGHNRAQYRYNNLTYVNHGNVDYTSWTTFNDTISIWSNATGDLLADVPGFGTDLLLPSEDIESSREIKYVVVLASRLAGYTWMPSEVLDIYLEYVVSTPSTSSNYWHDDGSSTEGWAENTTNIENQVQYYQSGIPLLTNGTGLYSDTIPGYASDLHGVNYLKKLETPMKLKNNLDFRAEINHIGTLNRAGSVGVVLLDENNASIFKAGGVDGWLGSTCNAWVAYKEGGIQTSEYNTKSGAWSGVVRVWYDSETLSIKGDAAGTEFTLASTGTFDLSREVHWVAIVFYLVQSYTYESHIITDISISANADSFGWHHDGSNTTAFTGVADDTWYGNPNVHVDGSISSTGGYLYANDYGTGTVSYGPMLYHTFTSPFYFSQFSRMETEIELEGFSATPMGAAAVVLFDDNQDPVITINVADAWDGFSSAAAYVEYTFSNGTRYLTPYELPSAASTPYHEMIIVELNSTGLFASIARVGSFMILDYDSLELERIIPYVAINFRASASSTVCQVNRIHDIIVDWADEDEPPLSDTLTIDSPADIAFEYGTTSHNITWSPSSTLPSLYELYVNGELAESGNWNGSQIVFDLAELTPGIYNYTLSVSNTLEHTVSDEVLVVVAGQAADGTIIIIAASAGSLIVIVILVGAICRSRRGIPGPPPVSPGSYDW